MPTALLANSLELKVSGNKIVTVIGNCPIFFKGANLPSLEWKDTSDGPILTSAQTIVGTWGANIMRIPMNQDRWLGTACGTNVANYQAQFDGVVNWCNANNVYVLLDLHWSDTGVAGGGSVCTSGQHDMPDDNSATFWTSVATRYANNNAVLFDLYNEPKGISSWTEWRNGGNAQTDGGYHSPGMQSLLNTVRATGAKNIVIAGGLNWAFDLTGIPSNALNDATGNGVVYATHIYPWKASPCDRAGGCFDGAVPSGVHNTYAVMVTEFGQDNNAGGVPNNSWSQSVMDWAKTNTNGYIAWCLHNGATPSLITDWAYTPSSWFGTTVKADMLATSPGGCVGTPTFTSTRTSTATRTVTPSFTRTVSSSPTSTATSTLSSTLTNSPSATATVTPTSTRSATGTSTVTPSNTPSHTPGLPSFTSTATQTSTATYSPTNTPTFSNTATVTATVTRTSTPTESPSSSVTLTNTPGMSTRTDTATLTSSPSITPTFTASSSSTSSATATETTTNTVSSTPTGTVTLSNTPGVPSFTQTSTASLTSTYTGSTTQTSTGSPTLTDSPTATPLATSTASPSPSFTNVSTGTCTATATPSSVLPAATGTSTATPITAGTTVTSDPNGPLEIHQIVAVPNPNPALFDLDLEGPAEAVELSIYTKSMVLITKVKGPGGQRGWVHLPLPAHWNDSVAGGTYYAVALAMQGQRVSQHRIGKFIVIR